MKLALTFDDVNIIPDYSYIKSRKDVDTKVNFLGVSLSCPVIPSNMRTITGYAMAKTMHNLGSIGVIHRFGDFLDDCIRLQQERIPYAMSLGTKNIVKQLNDIEDCELTPKFVIIDVAHGFTETMTKTIETVKKRLTCPVVAGNVATGTGAAYLAQSGADAIKVGIGNGSVCETRIRTGIGVPQFTALQMALDGLQAAGIQGIPIISDGGVKTPGDVAKALGAGASVVMTGSLFAGTKETPGALKRVGIWPNEQLYKEYAGSASLANGNTKNIEGNSTLVQYKGHADRIFLDIQRGLRSALSYVGAHRMDEFIGKAEFVQVTQNGTLEAKPYLLL